MIPPLDWLPSLKCTFVLLALTWALLFVTLRDVSRIRAVRRFGGALALGFLLTHAAWRWGRPYCVQAWGCSFTFYGSTLLGCLSASLPFAALCRVVAAKVAGRRPAAKVVQKTKESKGDDISRRHVITAATMAVPILAVSAGIRGFTNGVTPPELRRILVRSANLSPELDGLSILQLSDLHLGASRQIGDLDAFLDRIGNAGVRPDLVVFTGDVADDIDQIAPALRAAGRLSPRLGVHCVLGNHEYLNGIVEARREYDKAPVNLLVGQGARIRVGGSMLHLAGADDPFSVQADIGSFLRRSIESALDDRPADAYSILLGHRPESFLASSGARVDLTLSGHTHGGQIGFNGKSAFEPLARIHDEYLWGLYQREGSTLYTTSGWGHWFPFRLGCPAEAPLLVLQRSV